MKSRRKRTLLFLSLIVIGSLFVYLTRPFVQNETDNENISLQSKTDTEQLKISLQQQMKRNESDALYAIQDTQQVASIGSSNELYNVASIRKSIISALFGIAEEKRLVDLDMTLGQLSVDDSKQPLTKQEKSATIRDLLQARSGIYLNALGESQRMKDLRPKRESHTPGSFYYYNNWDFNMLGLILEKETKMKIGDAFEQWIAKPVGMKTFSPSHVTYEKNEETSIPMYRFYMSAENLARFGALYAQDGKWKGRSVIPIKWVEESTMAYSKISDVDRFSGYGYLWWLESNSKNPLLWGVGSGGQFLIVDRKNNLSIALLNDTGTSPLSTLTYRWFGQESTYAEARAIHRLLIN